MARRAYGAGSLQSKTLASGRVVWVGLWYDGAGNRVKRHIGPKRMPGTSDGLTKPQAERELRKVIDSEVAVVRHERITVADAGERYVLSREAIGRSPITLEDYRSIIRTHFEPFFGEA